MAKFWVELKRRKVVRVAAVYAVVAWLIVQVVGAIIEPLNLPNWFDTFVIVLLAVGFPIALILGWVFDFTATGIRATSTLDPQGKGQAAAAPFTYIVQGLVLLAVCFLILDQYIFEDTGSSSNIELDAAGEPDRPDMRLDIVTPPTTSPASFALSPDGRRIAFVANGEDGSQLWARSLDRVAARPLAGTEGAAFPFWSPDSNAIAFFADGQLKRVSLMGGQPLFVADAPSARGGAWGADGVIVFAPETTSVLVRVDSEGHGTPAPVTTFVSDEASHRWPRFLPDGRRFLFNVLSASGGSDGVYLGSVDGNEPVRIVDGDSHAVVVLPEHLMVVSKGALLAYPFDVERAAITGKSEIVAEPVGSQANGVGAFSVSQTGLLAYRPLGESPRELVWFDRSGTRVASVGPVDPSAPTDAALSPDGERIAVSRWAQGNNDIWLYDPARGYSLATDHPSLDIGPVWSPDSERLVFASNRNGTFDLFMKSATVSGDEKPLLVKPENLWPQDWSPDGRYLLYTEETENGTADLWALPLEALYTDRTEGTVPNLSALPLDVAQALPVARTEYDEVQGQFSPDGNWIAYATNRTGVHEVFVEPFPNPNDVGREQISFGGGSFPIWAPTGDELFFLLPDDTLMAVPRPESRASPPFDHSQPVPLFSSHVVRVGTNIFPTGPFSTAQYAIAANGRLLMNVNAIDTIPPINLVLNWTAMAGSRDVRD